MGIEIESLIFWSKVPFLNLSNSIFYTNFRTSIYTSSNFMFNSKLDNHSITPKQTILIVPLNVFLQLLIVSLFCILNLQASFFFLWYERWQLGLARTSGVTFLWFYTQFRSSKFSSYSGSSILILLLLIRPPTNSLLLRIHFSLRLCTLLKSLDLLPPNVFLNFLTQTLTLVRLGSPWIITFFP